MSPKHLMPTKASGAKLNIITFVFVVMRVFSLVNKCRDLYTCVLLKRLKCAESVLRSIYNHVVIAAFGWSNRSEAI